MSKWFVLVLGAAILAMAGFGASALAGGGTWPVNCAGQPTPSSMRCVASYLNALHGKDRSLATMFLALAHEEGSLNTRVSNLENAFACIDNVFPVTQYSGYGVYTNGDGSVDSTSTALDTTHSGDGTGEFLAVIDPACVKPTPQGYRFSLGRSR